MTFAGRVEPLTWGRATYTIFRLPDAALRDLGRSRRVEGKIADHPLNLAVTRAPVVEGVFLWAGQNLLDRIGIQPGKAHCKACCQPLRSRHLGRLTRMLAMAGAAR